MRQTGKLPFAAGNIVKGTIIEVRPKEVLVDIGYKSEGVISGNEFEDIKTVKVGDQIDVLIEKLEDKEGMVVLSKEKAEFKTELGTHPHHLQRRRHHRRQGQSHRQRRPAGQHRRRGLSARLADRRHHPQEPRPVRRQHLRFQGRQDQPGTAEHRPVPPRIDRAGTHRSAARSCSPK